MKVIVNKRALIDAIVESLSEDDGPEFERIDVSSELFRRGLESVALEGSFKSC